MNNYIFDLDGTLINSSEEVLLCMDKAFRCAKYNFDEKNLTPNVIGPPLKEIIKLIAPELNNENKISEIIENFRNFYDNDENDISILYPNTHKILQHLRENKKRLFLATFKPEKPTLRIIQQFKLNYFEEIYTIDKFKEHISKEKMIEIILEKYNLDCNETCMIGDAPSDMIAAKKNNIKAIGAYWGYGDNKTELLKNADIIIKSIEELCLK